MPRLRSKQISLLAAAALLLAACGTSGPPAPGSTAPPAPTEPGPAKYAGSLGGTRTFLGIAAAGERAAALLTDGTESVSLFVWFAGGVEDGAFTATANNISLSARLGTGAASGTVLMPDGRTLNYVVPRVRGGAGPYRAESNATGQPYTAGWIVLPDGEQRAAAAYGTDASGRVVTILPLDFGPDGRPTVVDVPGVGRFQPEPLVP
ncbi:MAG TPA: hypothetical protein VFR15_08580 [Chloroflexia bacterium]|nr:hypothetical protein [Chloroflexia bacterium]